MTIRNVIIDLIRLIINEPSLVAGDHISLNGLGIDSLALMDLVFAVEGEFGIEFGDRDLMPSNLATIGSLIATTARLIDSQKSEL